MATGKLYTNLDSSHLGGGGGGGGGGGVILITWSEHLGKVYTSMALMGSMYTNKDKSKS